MHELSIAASIIESVTESMAAYPGARVVEVRLKVGALSAVVPDSLEFCWSIAVEGTRLAGARLAVNVLPVIVHCDPCGQDVQLEGVQSLRCPLCGEPSFDLRQGRELEIDSVEIDEDDIAEAIVETKEKK
jgi:hydrogenase nickel incorporation protein HypA/HybF